MEIQEPESEIGSIIVDNESVSYVFLLKIYNIYIYTWMYVSTKGVQPVHKLFTSQLKYQLGTPKNVVSEP